MTIQIPTFYNSFLETVGCCWQIQASDAENIASVKGTRVSEITVEGSTLFCRAVIEPARSKGRSNDIVHVHIEIATERYFSGKKPTISSNLEKDSDWLSATLSEKELTLTSVIAGFRIPVDQIALGSVLGSIIGFQRRLNKHHQSLLRSGTLSVVPENSGSIDSPNESLSFDLQEKDNKAYFAITVEGHGNTVYSKDCLVDAEARLTVIFNRMVLAQDTSEKPGVIANE